MGGQRSNQRKYFVNEGRSKDALACSKRDVPAHGVDVRVSEHLVALFANTIQSRELGLVVDTHAAQTDEAPLMQIGGINTGVLVNESHEGDDEEDAGDFHDGRHDHTCRDRCPTRTVIRLRVLTIIPFYTRLSSF